MYINSNYTQDFLEILCTIFCKRMMCGYAASTIQFQGLAEDCDMNLLINSVVILMYLVGFSVAQ